MQPSLFPKKKEDIQKKERIFSNNLAIKLRNIFPHLNLRNSSRCIANLFNKYRINLLYKLNRTEYNLVINYPGYALNTLEKAN